MKKIIKHLLFAIFALLVSLGVVNAGSVDKNISVRFSPDFPKHYVGQKTSNNVLSSFDILIEGKEYYGYCLNPNFINICGVKDKNYVECKRKVEKIDLTTKDTDDNRKNAGYAKIFERLFKKADSEGNISYEDRAMAHMGLRIYEVMLKTDSNDCSSPYWAGAFALNAYYFLANKLKTDDTEIKNAIASLGNLAKK